MTYDSDPYQGIGGHSQTAISLRTLYRCWTKLFHGAIRSLRCSLINLFVDSDVKKLVFTNPYNRCLDWNNYWDWLIIMGEDEGYLKICRWLTTRCPISSSYWYCCWNFRSNFLHDGHALSTWYVFFICIFWNENTNPILLWSGSLPSIIGIRVPRNQ